MAGFNMMALMNTASQSEAAKPPYELKTLPIDVIIPNPANHYSMAGIDELADSILIAGRVLQNIVVKAADADGRYMIISGHRRHLACQKLVADGHAEFANIAALVENEANENMRELMLIYTNSTARQLTDAEKMRQAQRATDILKQIKADGKLDAPIRETVARMLNTTSGQLARYAAIANNLTNPQLKEAFEQEKIGVSVAYDSSRLSDEGQSEIADKLHTEGAVTIRDVEEVKERETPKQERTEIHTQGTDPTEKVREIELDIKKKFKTQVIIRILECDGRFYSSDNVRYQTGGWGSYPQLGYSKPYHTEQEAIDAAIKRAAAQKKEVHIALWESGYTAAGNPAEKEPHHADAPPAQAQMEQRPSGNTAEQKKPADFPYAAQSPEAYAIMAVYGELKALRESYQGAAQRAIAVADNTRGAANFTAAAEYVEMLMEIVAQEMADIEEGEGAT